MSKLVIGVRRRRKEAETNKDVWDHYIYSPRKHMGEMLVAFFHLLTSFSRLLNLRQILVFLLEKAFLKMAKNPPPTSNSLGLICSLAYWKPYALYTFELFFRRKGFSIHQGNTDRELSFTSSKDRASRQGLWL